MLQLENWNSSYKELEGSGSLDILSDIKGIGKRRTICYWVQVAGYGSSANNPGQRFIRGKNGQERTYLSARPGKNRDIILNPKQPNMFF